jgi:hypothetical protein
MKFLKQKHLGKFSVRDQTLFTNQFGRAVMDLTGGLRLPQGTTSQRPQTSGVRYPASGVTSSSEYADGLIRYNLTLNQLECRIAGVWETVRAAGGGTVIRQTIGPGDGVEQYFGPLQNLGVNWTPPTLVSGGSASTGQYTYPLIVLVENVFQLYSDNWTLVQNPVGVPSASFYGGAGSYPTGYYLDFGASPLGTVPLNKYVTVLYNFGN